MKQLFKSFLFAMILPVLPVSGVEPVEAEPIVILGGGVGSLTSALYLGRAGLSPLVIEGPNPGGLLTQSHTVQNWPGVLEVDGTSLTSNMREQAKANGARFLSEEVIRVDFSKRPFTITTRLLDGSDKERQIQAASCIIAMGTQPNFLHVKGEKTYWGKGISNCVTCDGSLYKGKTVGVVGGGDAAVLEALYLSNIAEKVYVFIRKDTIRATEEKRLDLLKKKPNVIFCFDTKVQEIQGDLETLSHVVVEKGGKSSEVALDGLFLAIGSTPNSKLFQNELKLDKRGYIVLEDDQKTSLEGVYAIGDIVDPTYKQAISAAGDGAKAALQVQSYLSNQGDVLTVKNSSVSSSQQKGPFVKEITSEKEFSNIVSSLKTPLVIDFYASWCGPCQRIAPVLEHSAQELGEKVQFIKVNVEEFSDLSGKYKVRSMPTVVVLNQKGKETHRAVGTDEVKKLLQSLRSDKKL